MPLSIFPVLVCFAVPAGPLPDAVGDWARTMDMSVLYDWAEVKELWSHGANGCMTPQRALTVILDGTNLTYEILTDELTSVAVIKDCEPALGMLAPAPPCTRPYKPE